MATNPVIDQGLHEIGAVLEVRGRYRDRVLAEIRAHLEDATDAATALGLTDREAAERAIVDLGTPSSLAERFAPQATAFTRMSAGAAGLGVVLALASVRAANELHADGARLGSSVLYTFVWVMGWMSLLLLAGPAVALLVRHRGRIGRSGAVAVVALFVTALAAVAFHFADDSLLNGRPSADFWRIMLVVFGAAAALALAVMIRRARLIALWPLVLIGSGVALAAVHYLVLSGHSGAAGIAGLFLLAVGGSAYAVMLGRERPLA